MYIVSISYSQWQTHINEMKLERTALEATVLWSKSTQQRESTSPGVDAAAAAKQLEQYLTCLESLKGLEARLTEAEV